MSVDKWEALRQYLRAVCNEALGPEDRQVDANDLLIHMEILDESN